MVKRQTVWLSTMMVLSLMLIGYYTLGTPPTAKKQNAAGVTTNTTVIGAGSSVPASGALTNSQPIAKKAQAGAGSSQPSDWFVQASLDQSQQQSKVIQTLQNELSDPRISQATASQAYTQLSTIQTQQESASRVHDLLVGEGYPDSLVLFSPQNQVHVYVEANSISPDSAVKVINLVSQTLGIPSNQVVVTPHK